VAGLVDAVVLYLLADPPAVRLGRLAALDLALVFRACHPDLTPEEIEAATFAARVDVWRRLRQVEGAASETAH
jgi:hypothetical protein